MRADSDRGARWLLPAVLVVVVVATLALSAWQAVQPPHFVYSLNGGDENTYLQYDFSRATQAPSRPGQYLVTLFHELGLSGGWQNVLFDLATLLGLPLLCRAIFLRLGWSRARADFGAIAFLMWPMYFSTTNPLMAAVKDWIVASGMIYWINTPEVYSPAYLRTPEPQFSLLLLAAVTWAALRWRTFWPVYPAIVFMYPFVAMPTAFATLALHLRTRWPLARARTVGPLAAAFVAVGAAAGVYHQCFVSASVRQMLVDTRLPLLSLTSAVALLVLAARWRHLEPAWRFPTLAIALAPMAASNLQILSGVVAQPNNLEQYAGLFAVVLTALFTCEGLPRVRWGLLALGALLFLRSSYVTARVNQAYIQRLPVTPALVAALRDDPAHTVIDEVRLATLMAMLMPRQGVTALGYQGTYAGVADRYAPAYRCLKQRLLAERPDDERLRSAFMQLDHAYTHSNQDLIFATIGRKHVFPVLQDVRPEACDAPDDAPLKFFPVRP